MPVGYSITGSSMLLGKSYFISLKSETDYNFRSLLDDSFPGRDMILKEIAKITARMHNNNIIHKDYSPGNILFGITDTGVNIEIIDLNRMRFGHVDMKAGCVNFDRLPGTEKMFKIMAYEYASLRGFDPEQCYELIIKYNKELNETN